MTTQAIVLLVVFLAILLACTKPLGIYIAWVMDEQRRGNALETGLYRLCGVRADAEMNWKQYALAVLIFNTLGALFIYALQRWQAFLPLNPQQFSNVTPDSDFNTAVSFVTNTNWQGYSGG
jgi:K+-transporting ATPase ATPase A chain